MLADCEVNIMDSIKLIYNPNSGDKQFKHSLDACAEVFQEAGYKTHLLRATSRDLLEHAVATMDESAVVVAGGDGTVNVVVNALKRYNIDIPLGIIPAGTANDFASYLKMPKDPKAAAEAIMNGRTMRADLGLVNGNYFINVCGACLFTHISQQVDDGMKSTLGKLAYYLKSLEEIPNFQPISVRITNSSTIMEEDIFLFLALNSAGTGGFDKLVPGASISDGLFDFVAIKACPILDLGRLFIKVLKQDYLNDDGVIYFQDNYVKVELISQSDKYDSCDIDGEFGPKLPIEIRNIHKKVPLVVPGKA